MKTPKYVFKDKGLEVNRCEIESYDGERIGYMNVLFDKVENKESEDLI